MNGWNINKLLAISTCGMALEIQISLSNLQYSLTILLKKLRMKLLLTPAIIDKVAICVAIYDCAISLDRLLHSNQGGLTSRVESSLLSDFAAASRLVARSKRDELVSLRHLLALIDGQTAYLRSIDPFVCTLIRRTIQSAASVFSIGVVIPQHPKNYTAVSIDSSEHLTAWPKIPYRPARDAPNTPSKAETESAQLCQGLYEQIIDIEIPAAEVCAVIPLRFPTLPSALDVILARQTYDEGRHARLLFEAFLSRGGSVPEYEDTFRIWDNVMQAESLTEALCIEHVLGEGYALGNDLKCVDHYKEQNLSDLAEIHWSLHEDEMMHVTEGLRWFNQLAGTASDQIISQLEANFSATPPPDPWFRPDLRRLVGFTENQIHRQRLRAANVTL